MIIARKYRNSKGKNTELKRLKRGKMFTKEPLESVMNSMSTFVTNTWSKETNTDLRRGKMFTYGLLEPEVNSMFTFVSKTRSKD